MKSFISSSLILFIIVTNTLIAESTFTESHSFHTIEISSLLPASFCSHSINSKGQSKRPSTLQVFHRHGPCHKTTTKTTSTPSLSEILSHDESRVKSIQARLHPNPSTSDDKATLPAQSGQSLGSGNYIVKIGLGTPTKTLSLIFDTGSDLTWTQCQPCAKSCYTQQDPIFNPSSSTSFSNISCNSATCSQLTSTTGNTPGCSGSTCTYSIQYGDSSFSRGFLSGDKLTISPTDVFTNFLFGCGHNNKGLFGNTAGLIGLGRDPLSIVSQTAQKYGKYFTYCLPSTPSSTGYLSLRKSNTTKTSNVKFTPFSTSQGSSFYFIDIVAISVGGRQLPISQSVFQKGGSIIDSGTVITRLPPSAYGAMRLVFRQLMSKYPRAPAVSILDTCYDFSNNTSVRIPTISFTFNGNVKVDLHPTGILVMVSSSQACLAFAGNGAATDLSILGNTQQKTLQVVYDVVGGKLGFGVAGCK